VGAAECCGDVWGGGKVTETELFALLDAMLFFLFWAFWS
jgi:hypothetical protein